VAGRQRARRINQRPSSTWMTVTTPKKTTSSETKGMASAPRPQRKRRGAVSVLSQSTAASEHDESEEALV
jgi:hypothetical protein